MYYHSIVRNINSNIDTNSIDNMRKYIGKSGAKARFFMVKEISPANQQLHVHVCTAVDTLEEKFMLERYFDTHRLKAYVDKYKPMDPDHVPYYLKYMCKDINDKSEMHKDWLLKENDMLHTFSDKCRRVRDLIAPALVQKHVDDIFIDFD